MPHVLDSAHIQESIMSKSQDGTDGSAKRRERARDPQSKQIDALKAMPDVRLDRIEAMKRAITNGEFDTPERLQTAIRRMIDELHRSE
ncbi:MAG: flagellar biosynthesis anti-sigma factor FlgM [Planctomycetota bacterium]|nr:flagellar biosynthesis anti-sigma factor FlgM [Planctomycetota bacterium]